MGLLAGQAHPPWLVIEKVTDGHNGLLFDVLLSG